MFNKGIKIISIIFSVLLILSLRCSAMEEYPQRIVSLAPSLTEELYLLGAEDRIVGVTTYCQRPKQAQTKEKVGSVVEANIEKIFMLKPDIVLTSPLCGLKAKNKLKSLGIKIVEFSSPKDFRQICGQLERLGEIVGAQEKAREIINKAQKEAGRISRDVADLPRPKVFIQVGAYPLFTMNRDYFIHDLIVRAGAVNIAEKSRSGIYSREKVIEANPDCIIIANMGIIGEEEKTMWQKHKMLNAVKNNRIYIIDSYIVCSPTPVSFVESLKKIVGFLHQRGES
ncbi:MAG: cobalamin-binding protein [Candidatus Omnitrophica bacterium]|nr:cobalamin-binding protein [Candidatus Omnitrophota bacterium]